MTLKGAPTGLAYTNEYTEKALANLKKMGLDTTGANFNAYAYANNNPYKYVDPDGRFGEGAAERFSDSFNLSRARYS